MNPSSIQLPLWFVFWLCAVFVWAALRLTRPKAAVVVSAAPKKAPPKNCASCKHFNKAEGQNALRGHGPFMAAASLISPAVMGGKYDFEKEAHVPNRSFPPHTDWSDFGRCKDPQAEDEFVIRYEGDLCDHYEVGDV